MAARENQGLQIALIIFVMLTIILSVTTFIFFNNYKSEADPLNGKRVAAEKKAQEAIEVARTAQDERNSLMRIVGYPETDKREEFETKAKAEIQRFNDFFKLNLPEDSRSFMQLVDALAKTIDAKNKELVAAKSANEQLNQALKEEQDKFNVAISTHEKDKTQAVQNEKTAVDNFTKQVAALSQSKEQALGKIAETNKELSQTKAATAAELKKMSEKLTQSLSTIEAKAEKIKELTQGEPTVPDGRIEWVNARDNIVFVNVGSADGLQRRVLFSVYDKNATSAENAVKKGSIEIVDIRGPHLAQARILENTNSNPIVPGDIIYTPIWHPGQTQHFAIAGFIDFDNDLVSDREKLKDLIAYNGGIVDAEVDEKAKIIGQMTSSTQYLILGDPPTEKDEKGTDSYTVMRREASNLGVPTIQLDAFLNQIGYSVRSAADVAKNESGPKALRTPRSAPDGSKTSGEGFRTRRPPEKKNGDSAF